MGLEAGSDEGRFESDLVDTALADLDDDVARTGAPATEEDVDRAAERHRLSVLELAELKQRAWARGLVEAPGGEPATWEPSRVARDFEHQPDRVDTLDALFSQLRNYPLLDAAQEVALGRAIENGARAEQTLAKNPSGGGNSTALEETAAEGLRAKKRMVESNVRLAISNAKSFRGQGLEFPDLIQAAMPGLIRAAEKFDHRKGFKFSTYATWWIRQSISRAIADTGRTIRLPVHVVERLNRFRRTSSRLDAQLGREPTADELAGALEWDPAEVTALIESVPRMVSLETPLGRDGGGAILADAIASDGPSPYDEVSQIMRAEFIRDLLGELDDRGRRVIELRYGLSGQAPKTLDEVGRAFGLTRERIRQIEKSALKELKEKGNRKGIPA